MDINYMINILCIFDHVGFFGCLNKIFRHLKIIYLIFSHSLLNNYICTLVM